MHRTRILLSSLVVAASSLGALGCSSASIAPPSAVSFAKDVMPVFQNGCTLSSSCHGQPNNSAEENLYLGDHVTNTPAIIAQVYASLVNIASIEDPKMPLVTPSSTGQSYLSHKIVGDQGMFASDCAMAKLCNDASCTAQTPCGTFMPYLGKPLDPDLVATINNWIAQGAKDN